jgi:hypothetical protein
MQSRFCGKKESGRQLKFRLESSNHKRFEIEPEEL